MNLAVLAAVVALAAPKHTPPPLAWTASRLSAGHPHVILAPRPEARRAAMVVRFHAGAVDDGELPGLTRVAQHALVEASRAVRYPDLVRQLLWRDATLVFETGLAECSFTLEAAREDFDRLAPVVLGLLLAPEPDPAAFAAAQESARLAERDGTGRDMLAMIAALVVDDGAFGNRPTGTEAGVEAIGWREVQRHLAGPLAPANATVVLTGGFDAGSARRTLARLSGGKALPPKAPTITTPFSLQVPAPREIYIVGYRATYRTPEQVAVARLAGALVEERIAWFFRDRGVGYSQSAEPIHRPWVDLFAVTLPARDPAGIPLGPLLEEQIAAVGEGRITEEEFERNRSWVLAALDRLDDEPAALAEALADGNGGAWIGPGVVEALRALDREAFVRGAGRLLSEEASIRILYSPRAAKRGSVPDAYRRARSAAR